MGAPLPFPRLIQALDQLAPRLGEPVIAQTGKTKLKLDNIEQHENLAPRQFDELFKTARTVVAHAGIGCSAFSIWRTKHPSANYSAV